MTSGASDNEIQQVIEQIEQKYDSVFPLMDKKPGEIAKSAYTLGDQVAMLPCAANSDVLVFVRAGGTVTTEGRETFSVLVGGPISGAVFIVTFADAKTGEILGLIRLRRTVRSRPRQQSLQHEHRLRAQKRQSWWPLAPLSPETLACWRAGSANPANPFTLSLLHSLTYSRRTSFPVPTSRPPRPRCYAHS